MAFVVPNQVDPFSPASCIAPLADELQQLLSL